MSTALTGMVFNARRGCLKKTNQITAYHSGDDGDYEKGLLQQYDVLTTGTYSGLVYIDVAHYANNGISFVAPNQVNDAAAGLATILTGDTVVIKGSASNNGAFVVAGGGVGAGFTTVAAIVNEGAGAYVSLYKRTPHSNEYVRDLRTGLMWSRNTSTGEKIGEASNGTLIWADVTKVYTIYSSANTISCIAPNIFRVIGGAALTQFHVGDLIRCVGFANAVNNLVGYRVLSVTVNGPDLDIVIDPINQVLVAEGAVGDSIGLVCRSAFNYAAGANTIGVANYTDWRNPNREELDSLGTNEPPFGVPNAVAFPGWMAVDHWTSTTAGNFPAFATMGNFASYVGNAADKTSAHLCALVRG